MFLTGCVYLTSLRSIPTRPWTDGGEGQMTVSHPGNKHTFMSLKSKQEQMVTVCLIYHLIHPHISQDEACLPSLSLFLRWKAGLAWRRDPLEVPRLGGGNARPCSWPIWLSRALDFNPHMVLLLSSHFKLYFFCLEMFLILLELKVLKQCLGQGGDLSKFSNCSFSLWLWEALAVLLIWQWGAVPLGYSLGGLPANTRVVVSGSPDSETAEQRRGHGPGGATEKS